MATNSLALSLDKPSSSSTIEEDGEPKRNEKYYIPSGDVVFRVEKELFRVHRHFFVRESPLFRDMLSLPSPSDKAVEGTSDKTPIYLPQVTSSGFEHFLWVFYNPKYADYDAPLDTWTAILQLAHRWQFAEVHAFVFRALEKLSNPISLVTRVRLAVAYDAPPDWHARVLAELGARPEPLTPAEGLELGLETTIVVAALRERIRDGNREMRGGRHGRRDRSRSRSYSPPPIVLAPQPEPYMLPVVPPMEYAPHAPHSPYTEDVRLIFTFELL
ncbi:hypothetical protein DFH11DRAFT_1514228 [Phellopilus nigrolimitatus]|nr:hypothetical protein DFH11DRAFT_1514228 [Phellopilus nigrolimitatus]